MVVVLAYQNFVNLSKPGWCLTCSAKLPHEFSLTFGEKDLQSQTPRICLQLCAALPKGRRRKGGKLVEQYVLVDQRHEQREFEHGSENLANHENAHHAISPFFGALPTDTTPRCGH